jgi:hypothetical protein
MMLVAAAPVMVLFSVIIVMVVVLVLIMMVVMVVGPQLPVLVEKGAHVLVIMAAATVMVVVPVLIMVIVIMAAASVMVLFLIIVMVVMLMLFLLIMVVILIPVMVMVVMVMLQRFRVDGVVEPGIIDGMQHDMGELVLIDVEDGAHEVELDLVLAGHGAVVLDPVIHVDEVQGYPGAVVLVDCGLDVAEKTARFALDVLSDGHQGIGEPCLGVGVEVEDLPGEAGGGAPGLLDGVLVVVLVLLAHSIIS